MLVVEVYDEPEVTMKYCSYNGKPAAHYPFNFNFIQLGKYTNSINNQQMVEFEPKGIKGLVDKWLNYLPKGCWSNWVVNLDFFISIKLVYLTLTVNKAKQP